MLMRMVEREGMKEAWDEVLQDLQIFKNVYFLHLPSTDETEKLDD